MKDYEKIEDDLAQLLKEDTDLNSLSEITPLPDTEAEQKRNLSISKAYVVYTGSDYGSPENNSIVIQEETMSFEVILRSRKRRGEGGILDLLQRVGVLLQGKKMYPGCDPITLSKTGYIDGSPNDFNYVLAFSIVTKSASALSDPDAEDPSNNVYKLKIPEFITK